MGAKVGRLKSDGPFPRAGRPKGESVLGRGRFPSRAGICHGILKIETTGFVISGNLIDRRELYG